MRGKALLFRCFADFISFLLRRLINDDVICSRLNNIYLLWIGKSEEEVDSLKKNIWYRGLSLLAALAMLATSLPVSVFAQEILAENVPVISEDAEPAALPLRLSRPRPRAPIRDLRLLSPPRLRPLRIPL